LVERRRDAAGIHPSGILAESVRFFLSHTRLQKNQYNEKITLIL